GWKACDEVKPQTQDAGCSPRLAASPETRRDTRNVSRSSHNPEVAGSNPAPATRQNGPPEKIWRAVFVGHVTNFVTSTRIGWPRRPPRLGDEPGDHLRGGPVLTGGLAGP